MSTLPRVLFVDDEKLLFRSIERALRRSYEFQGCSTGEDALEILRSDTNFAVLISDLRMPGMDGLAFLTHARALTPKTVQILMTASSSFTFATAPNLFRCIEKPITPAALLLVLDAAASEYARA